MEAMETLPQGWKQRTLDELCALRRELVEPSSAGTNRYVGLEHIDPGIPRIRRWGSDGTLRSTKNRFYSGDVLYGKLRPYLDKAALAEWGGVCSTDILTLQPRDENADAGYLSFLLHTSAFLAHAVATTSGVNHPRTSWADIAPFLYPTPSLPEQRAIAAVLTKIQAAVEVQDKIIATLKELKAATMAKLFREGLRGEPLKQTEIGEFPASWTIRHLGDFFDVQQGKALSPAARRGVSPRPFLRTANVLWGKVDLTTVDQMDFTEEETERLSLRLGDLLVCEGGEVGRSAVWNHTDNRFSYQNHIHRLRRKTEGIVPDFVMYWMQAAFLHLQLYGGVENKTTIPNLSGTRLKQLQIPVPPLEEQKRISHTLLSIDGKLEITLRNRDTLKVIFSSMLHLLMTGQVRVTELSAPEERQ